MNISVLKCIFAIIICHAPGSVDLHRARPLKNNLIYIVVNSQGFALHQAQHDIQVQQARIYDSDQKRPAINMSCEFCEP